MKLITEAILRDQLRAEQPEVFYIPEGKILSPAAREYLQQRKIKISMRPPSAAEAAETPPNQGGDDRRAANPKFTDYETGAFYMEKPEHMTHLHGNMLVPKDHPRIFYRGKLDSLQGKIVLNQAIIAQEGGSRRLLDDLSGILGLLREMMRCDVQNEELKAQYILGLSHAELRERSHDPMKHFKIQQMIPPEYSMGKEYALLNEIRTAVRETEVAATQAFRVGLKYTRLDIIEELNRLSSAVHIMMCMYLAGEYSGKKGGHVHV